MTVLDSRRLAEPPASLQVFAEPPNLLRHWGDFLRRRVAEIAAATMAVLVLTVFGLNLMPPHYVARTDVLLDPRRDKTFGPDDTAATASLDAASVAALCRKRTKRHAIHGALSSPMVSKWPIAHSPLL